MEPAVEALIACARALRASGFTVLERFELDLPGNIQVPLIRMGTAI